MCVCVCVCEVMVGEGLGLHSITHAGYIPPPESFRMPSSVTMETLSSSSFNQSAGR